MFKSIALYRRLKLIKSFQSKHLNPLIVRQLSFSDNKSDDQSISEQILSEMKSEETNSDTNGDQKTQSFAKAFEKFERLRKETKPEAKESDTVRSEPFPTLLRYSPFIQMGDPVGKVVVGRIEDVVGDDLYIDFGAKFNAVCKRPKHNESEYMRGAKVKLRINDLELSDRFLGSTIDMTLLEADATLLGIVWSPVRTTDPKTEIQTI